MTCVNDKGRWQWSGRTWILKLMHRDSDSNSSWQCLCMAAAFFRSHIVRSNDSLCRFTCHENHRSCPQWSPSSSKPSLGLTHGKRQILIGCQLPCQALIHNLQRNQETDRRICNTTVSPKAAWQNTEGPPAAASCCQIYLITIVYYCLQLSTKPFNCLLLSLVTCCWGVFVARRALTKSLTSFWGSTWHWLWMRQGCWSRLSSKLLECKVLWMRYLSPAKSLPAVKVSN